MAKERQPGAGRYDVEASMEIADFQYSRGNYEGASQLEKGTAETHELMSDVYMAGNNPDEMNEQL